MKKYSGFYQTLSYERPTKIDFLHILHCQLVCFSARHFTVGHTQITLRIFRFL